MKRPRALLRPPLSWEQFRVPLLAGSAAVAPAAVSVPSGRGQEVSATIGLCAPRTDAALLTNDLSVLLPFSNPTRDHCCIDLYVDCRAAFIADVFLESLK